jgi:hypothetical protein
MLTSEEEKSEYFQLYYHDTERYTRQMREFKAEGKFHDKP